MNRRVSAPNWVSTDVFIDAAPLREELQKLGVDWESISLKTLANVARELVGAKWQMGALAISRVFIYDVPEDEDVTRWLTRHETLQDTHVRPGFLAGAARKRRQKAVDVQLAVDALRGAHAGTYDAALFIAGDGDFVPVFDAVREEGPLVAACFFRGKMSGEVRRAADRVGELPTDPEAWKGWKLPRLE